MSDSYNLGYSVGQNIFPFVFAFGVGYTVAWIYSLVTKKKLNHLIALGIAGWIFVFWIISVSMN